MKGCNKKIIVFDLDETIGHFEQISIFLNGIQNIVQGNVSDKYIMTLLDIWPNIFRYKIFDVFKLIKKEKIKNNSIKVAIYTNNMGPRNWTILIKNYIENKLKFKLFDYTITAYRPKEKTNFRTTHEKTYQDLMRSVKCSKKADVLFFDDVYHRFMTNKKVNYVELIPYKYSVSNNKLINDYIKSRHNKLVKGTDIKPFKDIMFKYLNSSSEDPYIIKSSTKKDNVKQFKLMVKNVKKFLNIKDKKINKKYTRKLT